MKNIIIVLWIGLIGFIAGPAAFDMMNAVGYDEVHEVIAEEAEADGTDVVFSKTEGNKAMFAFRTSGDYGVAVFDRYGDRYTYREGTIASGKDHIMVNLDTGWDVYTYRVGPGGAELEGVEHLGGIYRIYTEIGTVLLIVTGVYVIYRLASRKRN